MISFKRLSLGALNKIAARTIHEMSQQFTKDSKISIEYSHFDKFASLLTLSLSPYVNARYIIQKLPELIFSQVYEALKTTPELEEIHFDVLEVAAEFAMSATKEQHLFIKKIWQQRMRIALEWEMNAQE